MYVMGTINDAREEHEQAVACFTRSKDAGLPKAMFALGVGLDKGKGISAPDYPAAADWYRRAADAGVGDAANNLSHMYAIGRGWAWHTMPAARHPPRRRPSFLL